MCSEPEKSSAQDRCRQALMERGASCVMSSEQALRERLGGGAASFWMFILLLSLGLAVMTSQGSLTQDRLMDPVHRGSVGRMACGLRWAGDIRGRK